MTFHRWLAAALDRALSSDMRIGQSLYLSLMWVNEPTLINLRPLPYDVRTIDDPQSPQLWDWLSSVEADWDRYH